METIKYLWDLVTNTWYRPSTTLSGDLTIAKKTNGNLICILSSGGVFKEGECPNVETLTSQNDSAIDWTTIPITTNGGFCAVSRVGNELFLCVTDKGVSGTRYASTKLYRSLSGNGGDWEDYATLSSLNSAGLTNFTSVTFDGAGCISVLANGRWVLPAGKFSSDSGYMLQLYCVWTSDDFGITWVKRFEMHAYISTHDYYLQNCPRHIAATNNGDLYIAYAANEGGTYLRFYKSTDNGATWELILYAATKDWLAAGLYATNFELISNGDAGLYMYCDVEGRSNVRIYEILDPVGFPGDKKTIKDLSLYTGTEGTSPSLQIIDDKLVLLKRDYLLGVREERIATRGAMYYKAADGSWRRVMRCR